LVGLAAVVALTVVMTGIVLAGAFYVGSKADIDAIKAVVQQTPSDKISGAHVVGDYALIEWNNEYAGEPQVCKRISGERWKLVMTGHGGPMFLNAMLEGGVPESIARQLCSGWPKGYGMCVSIQNGKSVAWPPPQPQP
jgi:hypothetical protein